MLTLAFVWHPVEAKMTEVSETVHGTAPAFHSAPIMVREIECAIQSSSTSLTKRAVGRDQELL